MRKRYSLAIQNTSQFMQALSPNAGASQNRGGSEIIRSGNDSIVTGGGCSYVSVNGYSYKMCNDGSSSF